MALYRLRIHIITLCFSDGAACIAYEYYLSFLQVKNIAVRYMSYNGIYEVLDPFETPNHVPFEAEDILHRIYQLQKIIRTDMLPQGSRLHLTFSNKNNHQ
jgi:hypothetical protein